MNKEQYRTLECSTQKKDEVSIDELIDRSDRTLIYGYTIDRETFHLYLENGQFNLAIYDAYDCLVKSARGKAQMSVSDCRPSKRAYPERSDFEFAMLMKKKEANITFTTFSKVNKEGRFHGKRVEELIPLSPDTFTVKAFEIKAEMLGISEWDLSFKLGMELQDTSRAQMEGYLRSIVLEKSAQMAWINNLPGAIEYRLREVLDDYMMTERSKALLKAMAMDTVEAKTKEIEATLEKVPTPLRRRGAGPA